MKNPYQVLSEKTKQIAQLQTEVDALYAVLPLLHEPVDVTTLSDSLQGGTVSIVTPPLTIGPLVAPVNITTTVAAPTAQSVTWDATKSRWP